MMKKIGYEVIDKGLDIEFHYCAADPILLMQLLYQV